LGRHPCYCRTRSYLPVGDGGSCEGSLVGCSLVEGEDRVSLVEGEDGVSLDGSLVVGGGGASSFAGGGFSAADGDGSLSLGEGGGAGGEGGGDALDAGGEVLIVEEGVSSPPTAPLALDPPSSVVSFPPFAPDLFCSLAEGSLPLALGRRIGGASRCPRLTLTGGGLTIIDEGFAVASRGLTVIGS
jgi:hypothetical protein